MTRMITVAVLTLTWIAFDCSAAPPEGTRGQGPREAGQREAGQRGGAERGQPQGQQGGQLRRQQRGGDPTQMVARMIQQYDKDGDQKLDANELSALLTSMRERRAGEADGARPGPAGGRGAGQNLENLRQRMGDRRRNQADNGNNQPGGEKPKRPVAE